MNHAARQIGALQQPAGSIFARSIATHAVTFTRGPVLHTEFFDSRAEAWPFFMALGRDPEADNARLHVRAGNRS